VAITRRQMAAIMARKRNKDEEEFEAQRFGTLGITRGDVTHVTLKPIPRKCTMCGSTVSQSRARSQQGERFVHAPFCSRCEREHSG